jgi:uridylate kinase
MKRIIVKLSGEALAGDKHTGFDEETVRKVAVQIKELIDDKYEIGIVIGGGNFWRGRSSKNIDRTKADQIGMLATVMNCIYTSEIFRSVGMKTEVLTPFMVGSFTKLFSKDLANECFEAGKVVFFAGGTGHPYFSTDTGVLLRAIEVDADVILLAKSIDGVYDADPNKDANAKKYDEVSIQEVIDKNLQVVDVTASILARDNEMEMYVFSLNEENSIVNTVKGNFHGTRVTV